MSIRFESDIRTDAVVIRLVGPRGDILSDDWALAAPSTLLTGVDLARRLDGNGEATFGVDYFILPHGMAARLTSGQAHSLGLTQSADVTIEFRMKGVLGKPGYGAELRWRRSSGLGVIVSERRGAFLKIGNAWQRLPKLLFDLVEAIDHLNAALPDIDDQLKAQATLQALMSEAAGSDNVEAKGYIGKMTISVADAFSLNIKGEGDHVTLVPILHRAGVLTDKPLLSPELQAAFGEKLFQSFGDARKSYAIGDNSFVVLSEPLVKALGVVRRFQNRSPSARKAFFANPRVSLRSALGEEVDEAALEDLVRDTKAYSDRVIGLGLWTPRIIPWIDIPSTDWLGKGEVSALGEVSGGIILGDRRISLTSEEAEFLQQRMEIAIEAGEPIVRHTLANGDVVEIPATRDVLVAISAVADRLRGTPGSEGGYPTAGHSLSFDTEDGDAQQLQPTVLLIRSNEDAVDFEAPLSPRSGLRATSPVSLRSVLKAHQVEGLTWLQQAWSYGNPGVLLADDMGLGKTLQALAFLVWLRENMLAHRLQRRPILIVAPTGLLANWRAEHDRHLTPPGLGSCLEAYGKGLMPLKKEGEAGQPDLDRRALEQADWVLTTYETLRDYVTAFGAVRFAALLFDEAQKIKNPGVRLTDAAKAAKADFVVAMTGTPVENRLSDLWCITDTVHPAFLGDLKSFSNSYEKDLRPENTRNLRKLLDQPRGSRPPIMLRRLKRDRLPDLPPEHENLCARVMPPGQYAAYSAAVKDALEAETPGAILQALHAFRRISLHPDANFEGSDEAFIAGSARLLLLFETLDKIARSGERALIFLEERDVQARLIGIIQRRYKLPTPPMLINGEVEGLVRQQRVDRFQEAPAGFDAMVLSPKAGGVGLTLTSANHVIHLSRWWNPAVEDQCTGRAMRIGQIRPVHVYIPIATLPNDGRSFDENLHLLLDRKRNLSKDALLPSEVTGAEKDDLFKDTVKGGGG